MLGLWLKQCENEGENWGSGGPPGKFVVTAPFRSLENVHLVNNVQ